MCIYIALKFVRKTHYIVLIKIRNQFKQNCNIKLKYYLISKMSITYLNNERSKMVYNGYRFIVHEENKGSIRWRGASCGCVYVSTIGDEVKNDV